MLKRLNILFVPSLIGCLLLTPIAYTQDLQTAEQAREQALDSDADTLAPKQYSAAEKSLTEAVKLLQQGSDAGKVTAAFRDATEAYETAELTAIIEDVVAQARAAIKDAESLRAKRYAPVTLKKAVEQLAEAEAILQNNREEITRAAAIANEAEATAIHAAQIAALAREKPATEDLLIEWEAYLFRIQQAAGMTMAVDTPPEEVTTALETEIERIRSSELQLRKDLADSQAFAAALEDEIRELDQQLGGAASERRELMLQLEDQARTVEQFAQTEALFSSEEASVYRKSNNVVISLFGLEFDSGSSELNDQNKELLNKINRAIEVFPDCKIHIEGHTDSQGGSRLNQKLSENRAQSVQKYLIENFRIAPERTSAEGFGASRPIANNETREGRAKNRRIDVILTP